MGEGKSDMTVFKDRALHFLSDDTGAGTVTALFFFTSAMALGGLALDGANGYRERAQLQTVTDAVSLAAAAHLDDTAAGRALAADVAERNLGPDFRDLIRDEDIVYGTWDAGSRTFTPSTEEPNAVVVSANRRESRGTGVGTHILSLVGIDYWDVSVSSFAAQAGEEQVLEPYCGGATILTSGDLRLNGGNTFEGRVCLHGEQGIFDGGSNYYGDGVVLSSPYEDDIVINGNPTRVENARAKIMPRSLTPSVVPTLPGRHRALMDTLMHMDGLTYSGDLLPAEFQGATVQVIDDASATLLRDESNWAIKAEPNMIYVTRGDVRLDSQLDFHGSAVIAGGTIQTSGNSSVKNAFLFADGRMQLAGGARWGAYSDFCDTGKFNLHLLSNEEVHFGGADVAYGVLVAAPSVNINGAFQASGGLYVEADEARTNMGGNGYITDECETPLDSEIVEVRKPLGAAANTNPQTRTILVN